MSKWVAAAEPVMSASCCVNSGLAAEADKLIKGDVPEPRKPDTIASPDAFVVEDDNGYFCLNLMVKNMHCAACISTIENAMLKLQDVKHARVNMSTQRVAVQWQGDTLDGRQIIRKLWQLGYPSAPYDPLKLKNQKNDEERFLLATMAVAGFASANVMILSVAIWAGVFSDMGDATRNLFHWISALIALPAVVYSGRPFFRSAYQALKNMRMNMDVPISVAVILASSMSLYQTTQGARDAYFDASISLLFFLLIGRYLDFRARSKARAVAEHLLVLGGTPARVIDASGDERLIPADAVKPGMIVSVLPGERIAVDGVILSGTTDVDQSMISGETLPVSCRVDDVVFAGTLNLNGSITIRVTSLSDRTLLADIVRLMENAEQGRARYVSIADKVAKIYAPVVHVLAAVTFVGWMVWGNGGWQPAMMSAVAVLIITCPCALGLAVPVVQVVASGVLLKHGVIMKSGDALERLADIDTVVFDKTGTLTDGVPEFMNSNNIANDDIIRALALAKHSHHPLSKSLTFWAAKNSLKSSLAVDDFLEVPGQGLQGTVDGVKIRLGRLDWCNEDNDLTGNQQNTMSIWLSVNGHPPVCFKFKDRTRVDAKTTIQQFKDKGLKVILLSGDHENVVSAVADELTIDEWHSSLLPAGKVDALERLEITGHKVLMVGDGLNDAPALSAGHVSISPSSAVDISKSAADFVFQGADLIPVFNTWMLAKRAGMRVKQNFALAFIYNVIAVPVAMAGLATPLLAAIAMSSSSILVTLNALSLRLRRTALSKI